MKNKNDSIRKVVGYLNNEEHDGGFWLPNIQRPFVWSEKQIEKLFDSIMREYPISTLLVWRTKSSIRRRKFIDNFVDDLKLSHFQVPEDRKSKLLVLDGQQRLQSLFIGLRGRYNKKEIFFDIFSGDLAHPEEMRYKFRFMAPEKARLPWVNFKRIVFSNAMPNDLADALADESPTPVTDEQRRTLVRNVWQAQRVFVNQEAISYQELDSVDNPDAYTEDDVVEIFIRANSGGTKLGKSDLLFSLLTASWDEADEAMEDLIAELNISGYRFSRDFILKTCLVLLGKGAAYDVKKFRDDSTKQQIMDQWTAISAAIKDVRDFLFGKTYIRSDHALPSYLGLIPPIYFRFHFPQEWSSVKALDTYFLRTLLCGAFGGRPDSLLNKCIRRIRQDEQFVVENMFEVICNDGRNLDVSDENLLQATYGSNAIHLIFNLWYRQFDYQPAYKGNLPQIDHIFPQSMLRGVKDINPETGHRSLMRYPAFMRDQIANCMLLTADENGFQNKCDIAPRGWFADKDEHYLDMHLIPKNSALWELENYEAFLEARQQLILDKMHDLLARVGIDSFSATPDAATVTTEVDQRVSARTRSDAANNAVPVSAVVVTDERNVNSSRPSNIQTIAGIRRLDQNVDVQNRGEVHQAENGNTIEALLTRFVARIAPPSKYIAGFRTADGKELALERENRTITLWTQRVDTSQTDFMPRRGYDASTPRNSNLNRKNCPMLRLGNPALLWKFDDDEELVDFVNWYSGACVLEADGAY